MVDIVWSGWTLFCIVSLSFSSGMAFAMFWMAIPRDDDKEVSE